MLGMRTEHLSVLHVTAWTILWAVLAMSLKDFLGTALMIAEARGRGWVAGFMDGLSDLANVVVNVVGAGAVILYGWNEKTILILAAMMVTSTLGTYVWVKLVTRILGDGDPGDHTHAEIESMRREMESMRGHIAVLEAHVGLSV